MVVRTLNYEVLLKDLASGRELEFVWNNIHLSINCLFPNKWCFTLMELGITFEANSVYELVDHICFQNGKRLSDILFEITDYTLY